MRALHLMKSWGQDRIQHGYIEGVLLLQAIKKFMKKKQLHYLLLSDYALVDQKGKPSFLGVFEKSQGKAAVSIPLFFVVGLISDVSPEVQYEVDTIILAPNDKKIGEQKTVHQSQEQKPNIGFIHEYRMMEFSNFGEYKVRVLVDGEKIGEDFILNFIKQE